MDLIEAVSPLDEVPPFATPAPHPGHTVLGEGDGVYSDNRVLAFVASDVKGNKASTAFDDIFIGP